MMVLMQTIDCVSEYVRGWASHGNYCPTSSADTLLALQSDEDKLQFNAREI